MLPLRGEKQMNKETLQDTTFYFLNYIVPLFAENSTPWASPLVSRNSSNKLGRLVFPYFLLAFLLVSNNLTAAWYTAQKICWRMWFFLNIPKLLTSHMYQSWNIFQMALFLRYNQRFLPTLDKCHCFTVNIGNYLPWVGQEKSFWGFLLCSSFDLKPFYKCIANVLGPRSKINV